MKSGMLVHLLLLSALLHETRGLRFIRGTPADIQDNNQEIIQGKRNINDGPHQGGTLCSTKHCPGRIRKLNMIPISSTVAKKESKPESRSEGLSAHQKTERHGDKFSADPSSLTEQRLRHEDILDIAGMDYSQARRKPPIHN